jgi:hypothetical protein
VHIIVAVQIRHAFQYIVRCKADTGISFRRDGATKTLYTATEACHLENFKIVSLFYSFFFFIF